MNEGPEAFAPHYQAEWQDLLDRNVELVERQEQIYLAAGATHSEQFTASKS